MLRKLIAPAALALAAGSPAVMAQPAPPPARELPSDAELLARTKAGTLTADNVILIEERLGSGEWRKPRLALSPRKMEEVTIRRGARTLGGVIVMPVGVEKAPVLLMMGEDQHAGWWAREMADDFAALGYIVVLPDFLYGLGPGGGGTLSFPSIKAVFDTHRALPKDESVWTADLNAWVDHALKLPRANGQVAAVGFAWGAGRIAALSASRQDLSAVALFYDAIPEGVPIAQIKAPVYGFYAEHDPRVTRSLPGTKAAMAAAGVRYEERVYPGSEHMFVRLGEEPRNANPANVWARNASLARLQEVLAAGFAAKR